MLKYGVPKDNMEQAFGNMKKMWTNFCFDVVGLWPIHCSIQMGQRKFRSKLVELFCYNITTNRIIE